MDRGRQPFVPIRWSLPFKIIASSSALVIALSGVFWHHSRLSEQRFMMETAAESTATLAELVEKSLREDFLHNDRESVQRSLASISRSESLRSVQVYDRLGVIAYSTVPGDVGHRVGRDEPPCLGCHDDPQRPRETLHGGKRYAIFRDAEGRRILSHVEPIYNEPACSAAECHAHPEGRRVLGILLAEFPLARLDLRMDQMTRQFTLFGLVYLLALTLLGLVIIWRLVLGPVRALSKGVERVGAGDLGHPVPIRARDELGGLAVSFNAMTGELAAARQRAERWTQSLEEQVAKKTQEIQRTEGKLAEAAKLAALGRLTAEIAHEIRNPLTALGGYGRRLQRTVRLPEEREAARIVVEEATRLEGLLKDILDFTSPPRPSFKPEFLAAIAEQSLAAFAVKCAEHHIWVAADLASEASAPVDAGQTRRAVDNLVANAIDAMPHGGTLAVSVRMEEKGGLRYAVVRVEDTGVGIAEEDLPRVFEPFWTTKKMGGGTGLGLPITRAIVEGHGGFVAVENREDGGLAASLWFPTEVPPAGRAAPADVPRPAG